MDFLSAFSGLERIVIIGGALLIGFWGYRLLASDRTPALVFMGIACAVLVGALFTGASHVKNVGESYQLATARGAASATSETTSAAVIPVEHPDQDSTQDPPNPNSALDAEAADGSVEPESESNPESTSESKPEPTIRSEPLPSEPAVERIALVLPATPQASPDLLSNEELGGRIVSVKSEAITLEWSPRDG